MGARTAIAPRFRLARERLCERGHEGAAPSGAAKRRPSAAVSQEATDEFRSGFEGANFGLDAAAFHGHWQLCEYLIELGARPGLAAPDTGETALHSALTNENRERYDLVVKVLLAAGADPNAPTNPGVPTGSFMRDARTRGETPLHRAALFGSPDTISLPLAAGASLEATDAAGESALAWASWARRPTAVLRLLLYGEHTLHPEHVPLRRRLLGEPGLP